MQARILSGMIKAVIFDFYGVIRTDVLQAWLSSRNIPMNATLHDLVHQRNLGIIGRSAFMQGLSDLSGTPPDQVLQQMEASAAIDPAVTQLIKALKPAYRVGLLTNAAGDTLRTLLDKQHLTGLFDALVISSEVGLMKPDARIYEYAVGQLGIAPQEAVFIDDSERNVAGAQEAGLIGLHYTNTHSLVAALQRLGVVIPAQNAQ